MRRLSWRWIFALLQVIGAAAALLYAPTQYLSGRHAIGDDSGLVVWRATHPPQVTRIAYAVSFPAMAATVPLRFVPSRFTERLAIHREKPLILLDAEDFLFVIGVGVLWYWIGAKVEQSLVPYQILRLSKSACVVLSVAGCMFAIAVGALALFYALLTEADRPWKQIAPFGLAWSLALLCYFSWRLGRLHRAGATNNNRFS